MSEQIIQDNIDKSSNKLPYAFPCVHSYEKQKKIHVVSSKPQAEKRHSRFDKLVLEDKTEREQISSKHAAFTAMRLNAALSGDSKNIPAYFPGQIIPASGGPNCKEIYRGTLFFEQWLKLFEFDAGKPDLKKLQEYIEGIFANNLEEPEFQLKNLDCHPVLKTRISWPWLFVEKPALQLIHFPSLDESEQPSYTNSFDTNDIEKLAELFMSLIGQAKDFNRILTAVRFLWMDNKAPVYSDNAIANSKELFNSHKADINKENVLPLLFELEALASYLTYSGDFNIVAQGLFANNWLEIGLAQIDKLRATEFCVTERLLDEIINLTQQRFAPIVVNEFYSVSDGNHRLTSAWLWNLLKFVSNCQWSLDDIEFQEKVASFCNEQIPGTITKFEVLYHLGIFLSNPKYRSILMSQVKTTVARYGYICSVPVLLLPEYLSTTVVKELYDSGKSTRRVPPHIYRIMSQIPNVVLPPRASYHFTDAALLPWFSVLPSAVCTSIKETFK